MTPLGNVTGETGPGATYSCTYDSAGRIATFLIGGVSQAAYTYDFAGRQAVRALTSFTIQSVFDSENRRIAEYNQASGALIREYVWRDGEALAMIEAGVISLIRTSPIGRPSFATNAASTTGAKVWTAAYSSFGGAPIAMCFPDQWFRCESGLCRSGWATWVPEWGVQVLGLDANCAANWRLRARSRSIIVTGNPRSTSDVTP